MGLDIKLLTDAYVATGMLRDDAKRNALQDYVRSQEAKQLEDGMHYGRDQVRQAIVHTRQDIAVICHDLSGIRKSTTSLARLLRTITILLLALVVLQVLTFLKW